MQFVQLVSWLLELNGQKVSGWNKYDDPTTASQNMVLELKKMNIELDMPASKLKTGHGDGVCILLQRLAQVILQSKFKFKKPVIKDESGRGDMDDDGDDMNDDMEGNADIADMMQAGNQSDDDIEDFAEFGGGGDKGNDADQQQNQIIQSSISREEWMLEVERVAHKLKIANVNADGGKEWRSHLDQTKKYADQVRNSLPDVKVKLERLSDEVSNALLKISKKEGLLSKSFQGMTGDYRAHSDRLREIQASFQTTSRAVQDMEAELAEVNERLSQVEKKIDETGKSFSDTSPLQKIKKSIAQVKNDIKSIDIRIGVVSNTLLQLKLKERAKQQEEKANGGHALKKLLENDYEMEI